MNGICLNIPMTVKIYIYKLYYTNASERQYNKNLHDLLRGNLKTCCTIFWLLNGETKPSMKMTLWFQKIIFSEILWLTKDVGSVNKCVYNVYCLSDKIFLSSLSNHECIWRLEVSWGVACLQPN